ncbi:SDR family oxidoreductase [Piscinibacter koreensis]|uniref:SDR family oxidoreductase n=1 Tax=Piscinibacter koreensis TaxID=2742824 RepID=A0A7Y6TUW1_9BURK|nr:SDR family oxidoreductase [Schlegelella koreensis]NUZ04277.1 SDR family oxidoreductase [Schlegelella koreensis]
MNDATAAAGVQPPGTVLVTGGSRGIGAATCLLLGRRGHAVAVNYASDRAAADRIVDEIRAAGGVALALQGDVAREADVMRLFEAIDRELPPLVGLVNNAGVIDQPCRVDAMDVARIERMFAINVVGSFVCAREAVRRMSTRDAEQRWRAAGGARGGAIVNLSSAAAHLGGSGQYVDYAAAKGAIETFTIGLAKEVAAEGIRVNAVRPGIIETDIHASGGVPDRPRQMVPMIPMQRTGSADEVAEAIVWLLSDAASYTTAAFLDVSGGR